MIHNDALEASRESDANFEDNIEFFARKFHLEFDCEDESSGDEIEELAILRNPSENDFKFSRGYIRQFIERTLEQNQPAEGNSWLLLDQSEQVQTFVNMASAKTEFKVVLRFPRELELSKLAKIIFVPELRKYWDSYLKMTYRIPLRESI